MNEKDSRIAKLSQSFKTHATGRSKSNAKIRERQSFYLDIALVECVDKMHKEISHQLYPKSISKSNFLETILEYGLESIEIVKSRLSEIDEAVENS